MTVVSPLTELLRGERSILILYVGNKENRYAFVLQNLMASRALAIEPAFISPGGRARLTIVVHR